MRVVLRNVHSQHPRAEPTAGVEHHVALSVVGSERMPDSGYLLAKAAQEKLIATRRSRTRSCTRRSSSSSSSASPTRRLDGDTVRLPPVLFQPLASDDVAAVVPNSRSARRSTARRDRRPGPVPLRRARPHAPETAIPGRRRSSCSLLQHRARRAIAGARRRRAHSYPRPTTTGFGVTAAEEAAFVPRFLDGSPHTPSRRRVHPRAPHRGATTAEPITVYLRTGPRSSSADEICSGWRRRTRPRRSLA